MPAPRPGARPAPRRQRATAAAGAALLALLAACGAAQEPGGAAVPPATAGATSARPPGAPASASPAAPTRPLQLAFAGDVHFEGVSRAALSGGLAAITPALSKADLTVVNLETAITTRGTPPAGKAYAFRAPASALTALKGAGVDVVSIANNHGMDFGQVGLADSLAAGRDAGLPVVGAGVDEDAAFAPYVAQVHGRRVAVIGATQVLDSSLATAWTARPDQPGLASAKDVERLVEQVRQTRTTADVVVVYLHWGTETVSCATEAQRGLARRLADAGADVVVGSHAHVLLGGGWLGSTYVDYGLGNFVFYARGGAAAETGVLTLTVQGRRVTDAAWAPARIRGGVPVPLSGAEATTAAAAKEKLRGCTGLAAAPG